LPYLIKQRLIVAGHDVLRNPIQQVIWEAPGLDKVMCRLLMRIGLSSKWGDSLKVPELYLNSIRKIYENRKNGAGRGQGRKSKEHSQGGSECSLTQSSGGSGFFEQTHCYWPDQ
ncbi:MAG TPA: hypothetical protein VGD99_03275, partial [Anaerolineae bacterium]